MSGGFIKVEVLPMIEVKSRTAYLDFDDSSIRTADDDYCLRLLKIMYR
jgi:hypothetical protein